MDDIVKSPTKKARTSTVGRSKAITRSEALEQDSWQDELVNLAHGDSLNHYAKWETPTCIVSDGGYGVLGFEGDTSDHLGLPEWYEPHIIEWSKKATAQTTLWFWNSEIGWAAVHPILEKHGWRYVNANIWNKGKGHIAGNVNTAKIRRFPVTTEICVQYVFEGRVNGTPLREWLIGEWERTGLPRRAANTACGVKDAATRKYLDKGHLWYFPPPEMFEKLQTYANEHGKPEGRPYFSFDGKTPAKGEEWAKMRAKFRCPYGVTNVWERPALRGKERFSVPGGKAVHLNQKPLDLLTQIIEATTDPGDVVWEPFGGLFSASVAARRLKRRAFSAEIDPTYFYYGLQRFTEEVHQHPLL
ncbi:DNA methyltransferase [Thioalkalivibrio sp. ALJT]|uniref:DNA methyltransferase n=1 Tax=Thioalkalivibrio sp. ALJT TaxID=1158146 RepID=UPI0009D92DBC|nr:DNA methyltransferase [Thioalkalivibrio sp. ALJT]